MGLKQQMKMGLGMTMTPQLQQAIKILQMSVMELQQEVTQALVENPVLEEDFEEAGAPEEIPELKSEIDSDERVADQKALDESPTEDPDIQSFMDASQVGGSYLSTRNMNSDEIPTFDQILSRPTTLADHLLWQLRMSVQDERSLEIGEDIIGNLNEDGYLMVLVDEIAERAKVDRSEVEAVLYRIQRFDPPGVGARDLQECLLIQAEILEEDDEIEIIIEKHMAELETKNYPAIARAVGIPLDRVVELCRVIHGMEPKPGRGYVTSEAQYITPDIYVLKVGEEYMIVLNEDGIPRLKISKDYQTQVSEGEVKGEAKAYLKDKLKGAFWLIKSILQRQRTIYRVTEAVVRRQRDFFDRGPHYLKPMVLRDIADELGLHESTISRVTTNKYMHTPHGIYELKYFFNSGISRGDGGDDIASESVKQKIKELVDAEDTKNPLSDQQLASLLAEAKIQIARRTVAKYREQLGILPSNKRKKYF
ncbi:MAG: RNA polymerase factor sigma-54 [Bdellovibrionales bacterium]|nr:RNA polymerase factor sigma-54 [Bdellovibrionales bacterium]